MSANFQATRRDVTSLSEADYKPSTYGKLQDNVWYCVPPNWKHAGLLTNHVVEEHPDGTITVIPSILIMYGNGMRWHGYLRQGIFEQLDDCVFEPLVLE